MYKVGIQIAVIKAGLFVLYHVLLTLSLESLRAGTCLLLTVVL